MGKNISVGTVSLLSVHTVTFSTALSWWFVRVTAFFITGYPGARDIAPVTVTDNTGVAAIMKLSAVKIFSTIIHAACKKKFTV